ncbi:unnamed protein product [Spodoptera exigua]|nr:unnamed protein product [Spodoptera exigua]
MEDNDSASSCGGTHNGDVEQMDNENEDVDKVCRDELARAEKRQREESTGDEDSWTEIKGKKKTRRECVSKLHKENYEVYISHKDPLPKQFALARILKENNIGNISQLFSSPGKSKNKLNPDKEQASKERKRDVNEDWMFWNSEPDYTSPLPEGCGWYTFKFVWALWDAQMGGSALIRDGHHVRRRLEPNLAPRTTRYVRKSLRSYLAGSLADSGGPLSRACAHYRSAGRPCAHANSAPLADRLHRRTAYDMLAPISRYDMENLSKSHIWLAAAAILATCGVCAGAGVGNRKPFTPTDSILDIIDTEQVQRFLAERQRAEQATASSSTSFVQRNELGDGSSETGMVVSLPEQDDTTELPPGVEFRKILKSSKNALVVTKKIISRKIGVKPSL